MSNYLSRKEVRAFRIATTVIVLSLIVIGVQFTRDYVVELPKQGGEYTEALVGAPKFINPILAQTNDTDLDLTTLIFTGLVQPNESGEMVPDIAESYEISEDQKEYTFNIRQDVYFHDGEQLTANDVQFTFSSILDPKFRSPLRTRFQGVGLQRIDDFTIKFVLDEPFTPFLEGMTFGILPEHLWTLINPENAPLAELNLKPVGTGPYAFDTLKKNKNGILISYTLVRNDNFYDAKPYIDTLIFKFFESSDSALLAVSEKLVDGVRFVPKSRRADMKKQNKNVQYTSLRLPQYTAIFFNQTNSLLKNDEIREALALAIDKDRIIREALENEGEAINGPILPGFIGYNPDIRTYDFDLELAKNFLTDKGWILQEPEAVPTAEPESETANNTSTEENTEGTDTIEESETPALPVRVKDGQELALAISTIDQPEYLATIEIIRESWEELGVRLDVKVFSSEDILRDVIKPRDYEALLFGEIVGLDPDPYPFWHSSQSTDPGLNLAVFFNKEVDQLLEEARKINDPEQRRLKYLHFQNILADKLPAIFLYNPTYTYAIHKNVKGLDKNIYISEPADRFQSITDWYIKIKRRIAFDQEEE